MPTLSTRRLFVLSPAYVGGERAKLLLNPKAPFPLARQFQSEGLPISAAFSFASGLYFRGKIAYAARFARPGFDTVRVITSNRGLLDPDTIIGPRDLEAFGTTEIDATDSRYYQPVKTDAIKLLKAIGPEAPVILLGSIATPKYRRVFLEVFGANLLFPVDFVGRGDMSRGALLLRASRDGRELPYGSVQGAVLTGKRAPSINRDRAVTGEGTTKSRAGRARK